MPTEVMMRAVPTAHRRFSQRRSLTRPSSTQVYGNKSTVSKVEQIQDRETLEKIMGTEVRTACSAAVTVALFWPPETSPFRAKQSPKGAYSGPN